MACPPAVVRAQYALLEQDGSPVIHVISNPTCTDCPQLPKFHVAFTIAGTDGTREVTVPGPDLSYGSFYVPAEDPEDVIAGYAIQWDDGPPSGA